MDFISFIFTGYYTADMSKMVVISSTFVSKVKGLSIVMQPDLISFSNTLSKAIINHNSQIKSEYNNGRFVCVRGKWAESQGFIS